MPGSLNHTVEGKRSRWISKPLSASKTEDFPVVAIGASAGGLDACRKLLDALPAVNGMAFIIVQHLDPSHDSMMVDLLAGHTSMPVLQAAEGMPIERERVYVIPPGVYLSVDDKGALRISKPQARHGARLPFDFLLNSLAREYGSRAVCVVLSGTGADGSLGLKSVKAKGGLVIAQDIREADYDGMPRSAVATGAVDLVLRAAKIAEALVARERGQVFVSEAPKSPALKSVEDFLPDIIAVLRTMTVHDFTLYKHGTLERRVERRMALAGVKTAAEYFDLLRRDANERDQLSRDLLINVTGFFRDSARFRISGQERHSRPRARPPSGSAAQNLGRRLQFRRGDLFPRHAFSRRDRRLETRDQVADLRDRRRSGRGGERSRRPLSRLDRGGRVAGTTGAVFLQGGSQLPHLGRAALERRVHGARRARRPAVLASRFRIVPESSNLPPAGGAGQGHLHHPLRVARRRTSACRRCRDGRRRRRSVRRHFQASTHLPPRRRRPTGRFRVCRRMPPRAPGCACVPARRPRLRARSSLPSFVDGWCWRPMVPPQC